MNLGQYIANILLEQDKQTIDIELNWYLTRDINDEK